MISFEKKNCHSIDRKPSGGLASWNVCVPVFRRYASSDLHANCYRTVLLLQICRKFSFF